MSGAAPSAPGRVVVVGSGHNALVGACYLARAGLDVEVVERDTVLGGAVSTVERFPGYRMDRGSSAHIMIRWTGIVEDLQLERFGLRYVDCDPWGFHPVPGAPGGGITFAVDLDRTCASIEAVCGARDADAYRAFVADWGDRNERVFTAFGSPPTGASLGRALWGTGKGTGLPGLELARQFLMPADALLDSLFDSEHLKTALSWLGAQSGPPTSEVATADLVGWNALLHRRPPGRAIGGSGALTTALRARLEADGGRVRLGDGAAGIETSGGRVTGVRTDSGDRLRADTVLAGCHVLTTYELLGDAVPAAEQERVRRTVRVGNGLGMVVRLGTTALPQYPDAPEDVHAGLVLAVPSRTALRRAYGDFLAGEAPREPAALGMAFSYLDPSIAPAGRHNVTVWGQWHPYELAGGEQWDAIREREGDKLVAALDRVAPGFASSVCEMHVQTPLDLERELGLRRGNVMHVEMSLDEMFAWRPLPELAGYRGPVDGLYLCGASTHPGGGVFGASGRSAAKVLLKDRTAPLWRRALSAVRTGVPMPQTGERVAHYSLQARLATGGMGVVYRAFDERTKRLVALKVLSAQYGNDPDYRARFAQEAELAARVEHPNIVPIYDVGGYPTLYIAMRLVPGTDLATVLRKGPLHPERALDIAESVAGALDEAHRHQMVHRDVKPGNVLLAPTRDRHRSEHVYLTDFGIARSLGSELRLSRPVVVLGSPAYMAPERLAGEPGGPSCDVYGLACVLFECFTGTRPWPQQAPPEEINRRQAVDAPRLVEARPDLPRGLDEALRRGMHRDPRQRPATAGDLAAACRSALRPGGTATLVPPAGPRPNSGVTAPYQRPSTAPPPVPPSAPPAPPLPPPAAVPPLPPPGGHRRRRRRMLLPLLVLALLVIAGAVVGGIAASRSGSGQPTAASRALEARLPPDVFGTCTPDQPSAGEQAVLTCTGRDPRVSRLEVVQVTDANVLASRFQAVQADRQLVNRRCADETGNSAGFWTNTSKVRQGNFACFTDRSGQRRLLWQYDGQAVEVQAVGKDGSAATAQDLYAWWSTVVRPRALVG